MRLSLFNSFSGKDQALFAKRLSFLVKADVPLLECLRLMRRQAKTAHAAMYEGLINDVEQGQYLSTGLERAGQFNELAVHLVRVGEHSGILSQNLAYLSDELHKRAALRRKVLGALVYPGFIVVTTLGLVGLLTAYIFPKLAPVFIGLHADLPASTRVLMATSAFLRGWGLVLLAVFVLLGCAFAYLRRRYEPARAYSDRALLYIPLMGRMVAAYNLATICRTLGLLLQAGVSAPEGMRIASKATAHRTYRAAYARAAESLPTGERLSVALSREGALFPPLMLHMADIGETTGNLSGTLLYLADAYEAEVDDLARNLSASMEPALMLIMGGLVGFVAISVITPIYGITQHLAPK